MKQLHSARDGSNGCIMTAQFRNGGCGFETELADLGITIR